MNMQSEQINELATALSKVQGELDYAVKDSNNPHFKSKYADLAGVWYACRDPLSKHGLSVIQTLELIDGKQALMTTLAHASGQWIKSLVILPIQKPGPQEMVSCVTYCRRTALAAIVGVYQDDDDAEAADRPYRKESYQQKEQKAAVPLTAAPIPNAPRPPNEPQFTDAQLLEQCKGFVAQEDFDYTVEDFLKVCAKDMGISFSDVCRLAVKNRAGFSGDYNKWVSKSLDELVKQNKRA